MLNPDSTASTGICDIVYHHRLRFVSLDPKLVFDFWQINGIVNIKLKLIDPSCGQYYGILLQILNLVPPLHRGNHVLVPERVAVGVRVQVRRRVGSANKGETFTTLCKRVHRM